MQHRFDGAQADRHLQRPTRAHLGLELALQLQHALGVDQKTGPCHRELEVLVAPIEQQHAQLFFESGDAAGHGRLREEQLLGRACHALEGGHPVEGFDKSQVHGEGSQAHFSKCRMLLF